MNKSELICGNCGKLARKLCDCSYQDLWEGILFVQSKLAAAAEAFAEKDIERHNRECLKRLEWIDKYTPSGRLMPFCPACGSPKTTGHQVDCWLAAEIGGE